MSPHLDEQRLAALQDRALAESDAAEVRAHLAGCAECRQRHDALQALQARLNEAPAANPALTSRILAATVRAGRPQPRRWWWWWAWTLPLPAAVAMLLFMRVGAPDGFTARGNGENVAPVHLRLYRAQSQGAEKLADGDRIPGGAPVRLAAAIDLLPRDGATHGAVYARDARGRVTWLWPAWTDARQQPECVVLPKSGAIGAPQAVELEAVSGPLEVGLLVLDGPCQIPELDAQLERGSVPANASLQVLHIHISPELP